MATKAGVLAGTGGKTATRTKKGAKGKRIAPEVATPAVESGYPAAPTVTISGGGGTGVSTAPRGIGGVTKLGKGTSPERVALRMATALRMIGDPTRIRVIDMLGDAGELHVGAMCDRLAVSQPSLSHHLCLMKHSGMVEARRDGKRSYYYLSAKGQVMARLVGDLAAAE